MNDRIMSEKTDSKEFQNALILKDNTSLQILEDVCKEKNIPLPAFVDLIRAAYKNKIRNRVKEDIDAVLNKME